LRKISGSLPFRISVQSGAIYMKAIYSLTWTRLDYKSAWLKFWCTRQLLVEAVLFRRRHLARRNTDINALHIKCSAIILKRVPKSRSNLWIPCVLDPTDTSSFTFPLPVLTLQNLCHFASTNEPRDRTNVLLIQRYKAICPRHGIEFYDGNRVPYNSEVGWNTSSVQTNAQRYKIFSWLRHRLGRQALGKVLRLSAYARE
jgi:hypothetical protein